MTTNRTGRVVRTAAAVATGLAALAATATTASALTATTSTVEGAAATSYGFQCNSQWGWLHQSYPNISVQSAEDSEVTVRSFLYRWDGSSWQHVATSATYVGVSNVHGRKQLGWTVGGLPYYFALAGQPSTIPSNDGYAFEHLEHGYYGTVEEYTAGGKTWTVDNHESGTEVDGCQV